MPELPQEKRARFEGLGLSPYDAHVLCDDLAVAGYFDAALEAGASPKPAANWIMGDIMAHCKVGTGIKGWCMGEMVLHQRLLSSLSQNVKQEEQLQCTGTYTYPYGSAPGCKTVALLPTHSCSPRRLHAQEAHLGMDDLLLTPTTLAKLLGLIEKGTISGKIAKDLLPDLLQGKGGMCKRFTWWLGWLSIGQPSLLSSWAVEFNSLPSMVEIIHIILLFWVE